MGFAVHGYIFRIREDKPAKGEGWASSVICCAQDTAGLTREFSNRLLHHDRVALTLDHGASQVSSIKRTNETGHSKTKMLV